MDESKVKSDVITSTEGENFISRASLMRRVSPYGGHGQNLSM
ncbi:hypothetical protein Mpsy_1290 [Methanolobus psychrophilus R15]|nr:hypothetical protein Mpsy_1290 [Methanolobus psychrophilus R15]